MLESPSNKVASLEARNFIKKEPPTLLEFPKNPRENIVCESIFKKDADTHRVSC